MGISLETSAVPNNRMMKNVISNNRVGTHTAYGIIAYSHQSGDTYNQIIGNYVENITGASDAQRGSAGAGIYIVGMGAVTIANNIIANCCTMTRDGMLAPGGIGINASNGCSAVTIVGNAVYDMAQGNSTGAPVAGIYVAAAPAGTVICGNSIGQRQAGGLIAGIFVTSGNSNLTITGNNINMLPSAAARARGILLQTGRSNSRNITISGNTVLGCSSRGISFEAETSGYGVDAFTISGNVIASGSPTAIPLYLSGARHGAVTGNSCSAGAAAAALSLTDSQFVCCSGNMFRSGGGATLSSTGDCAGSVFDESNLVSGAIDNRGTGLTVRQAARAGP